jgi:hypothetical protein
MDECLAQVTLERISTTAVVAHKHLVEQVVAFGSDLSAYNISDAAHDLTKLAPKPADLLFAVCTLGPDNTYKRVLGMLDPNDYGLDRALLSCDRKAFRGLGCT